MFCGIKSYNTCSNAVFRHRHNPTIVLSLVYCPADYETHCTYSWHSHSDKIVTLRVVDGLTQYTCSTKI